MWKKLGIGIFGLTTILCSCISSNKNKEEVPNKFSEYIGRNSHAESFVKNHKVLTVNSFFDFSKWYWDKSKFGPKGAGSKFSERVFASWVYNHLEGDKELEEISMQHKMPLIVPGVKKQVDLYLKTQRGSLLIEFKCNIDMVEKDLFKF